MRAQVDFLLSIETKIIFFLLKTDNQDKTCKPRFVMGRICQSWLKLPSKVLESRYGVHKIQLKEKVSIGYLIRHQKSLHHFRHHQYINHHLNIYIISVKYYDRVYFAVWNIQNLLCKFNFVVFGKICAIFFTTQKIQKNFEGNNVFVLVVSLKHINDDSGKHITCILYSWQFVTFIFIIA